MKLSSGPPYGGWPELPGTEFYGQKLSDMLPRSFGKINPRQRSKNQNPYRKNKSRKKRNRKSRPRSFGNNVSTVFPVLNPALTDFPRSNMNNPFVLVSGPGNTPGGDGGVYMQGIPNYSARGFGSKPKNKKKKPAVLVY